VLFFNILKNPLDLGADIAMHSLTKYLNGHSDVIMGAVMVNDLGLYERIKNLQIFIGAIPSPFDCYLVNRSLKTLSIRMQKHMENGLKVAAALENNPRVEKVIYPGINHSINSNLYIFLFSVYIKTNKV
jgi:cystathionine gamma-lyase